MGDDTETIPQAVKKKVILGVMSAMGFLIYWGWGNFTDLAQMRIERVALDQQVAVCGDIQKQATRLIMKLKETP